MENQLFTLPKDGLAGLAENYKTDLLSGFLVFLIALPLCLGIALASGFPPLGGIITAVIGGLVVGPLAGSPLTIKGPAAGLIAIAAGSVEAFEALSPGHGYQLTLAVIVVASVLQVVFGRLRAGVLGDFFPASAVHGMLAAIGVIIMSKQIHVMLGVKPLAKGPLELLAEVPHSIGHATLPIAVIGLTSLAILIVLSVIKNKYVKIVPAPLMVLAVAIPMGQFFGLDAAHDYLMNGQTFKLGPNFLVNLPVNIVAGITFPDFSQILTGTAAQYILMFALVGSLESLLTVKAIDNLDSYKRKSNMNRDLLAVGIGNTLCGLLGGLPMISEVVRSSANVSNGAKTRWSNIAHGFFLLVFVAFAPGLIHMIPLAALGAMLVFTGYRLASPKHFKEIWAIGKEQLIIFVVTIFATLATDLLLGVATGILVKLIIQLINGASFSSLFKLKAEMTAQGNEVRIKISNDALFSNYLGFKKHLDAIPAGKHVTFDFASTGLIDHAFMDHLHHFVHDYEHKGGGVDIVGLNATHHAVSNHPLVARKADELPVVSRGIE